MRLKNPQGRFEERYCVQLAMAAEVTSIAFDAAPNRVVVGNRKSAVHVFSTDSSMAMHNIFTVVIADHIPKAVAFSQSGGENRDVLTFGMYDGLV